MRQAAHFDEMDAAPQDAGAAQSDGFSGAARLRDALALACMLVGVLGLLGWALDVLPLKSILPGLTTMKANTALGILVSATGLLAIRDARHDATSRHPTPHDAAVTLVHWRAVLAFASGSLALSLGVLTLVEYQLDVSLGIDELLFSDPDTTSPPFPGRMSPATAAGLAALGAAILLLALAAPRAAAGGSRAALCAHWLACVPAGIGCLSLAGYAYKVDGFYSFGPHMAMALNTAASLAVLACAVLLTLPARGWGRSLASWTVAQGVFLRMLPATFLLPFALGLIVIWGARFEIYEPLFAPALFAVAATTMTVWLVWRAAQAVRRAEEQVAASVSQLLASHRFNTQLTALVPGVLYIFDTVEQRNVYVNPAASAAIGYAEHEVIGLGAEFLGRLIHPDDLPHLGRHLQRLAAMGISETVEVEYRMRHRNGDWRWFMSRDTVFSRDAAGRVLQILGVATDITERKRTEQLLHEQDRRKDEFLATLAHELRNPLAPVRNAVAVLHRTGPDRPDRLQWARDVIERQMGHMTRLIDDLLDVSRINQGKLHLQRSRVDLAAVVQAACETSQPLIEAGGHALTVTLPDEPVVLDADPARLAQALGNLLANAAKYTPQGGHIAVHATRQADGLCLAVRDTGIGIAADRLAGIFAMFSQVENSLNRAQGGLGIGLALVRQLVELHGGSVQADSEGPGRGSTFTIRLPLADVRVG